MKPWTVSNIENAEHLGPIEFQDDEGEFHVFEILVTPTRIVFGGAVNGGFLESGYIEREEHETLDDTLQEMLSDLEVCYNDGAQYVSRIICNERM